MTSLNQKKNKPREHKIIDRRLVKFYITDLLTFYSDIPQSNSVRRSMNTFRATKEGNHHSLN
jgi:hypothetical protein